MRCRSFLRLRQHVTFSLRLLARSPARPLADFPGSDRCFPAWLDRWQATGFHRLLRASCRLAAGLPTCVGALPPARPAITSDSHRLSSFSSAGLNNLRLSPSSVAASDLRLPLPQPASLRPLVAAFAKPVVILRLASAVSPSGFTGFDSPCLRLALHTSGWAFDTPLTSTEPCIAG